MVYIPGIDFRIVMVHVSRKRNNDITTILTNFVNERTTVTYEMFVIFGMNVNVLFYSIAL